MNERLSKGGKTLILPQPFPYKGHSISFSCMNTTHNIMRWDVSALCTPLHYITFFQDRQWFGFFTLLESKTGFYHYFNKGNRKWKITGNDDFWPSKAKRKRSGLGSMVKVRFPSSPLPSFSTLARSIRQKSLATSSSSGRKRFTAAVIITSLLSSRRSARHSSPFLRREDLEKGIQLWSEERGF